MSSLIIRDNGLVTPGILTRQPYADGQVGYPKADSLAERLRQIRPNDLEVRVELGNLLDDPLDGPDWTDGADVVVDTSAASAIIDKLELRRWCDQRDRLHG